MAATQNLSSLFGSRLSSAYNSLRGDLGAPQTATDTIEKLVDRIQTSAAVEDRRTAVLGLKGLSRDWKAEVGSRALPSLIAVLQHDAPYDTEIAKAALETFMQLCEHPEKPAKDDLGLRYTDEFLATPQPLHSLLALLSASPSFYPRFYSLQFLSQLLTARASVAQGYIISAPPPGVEGILSVLDSRAPPPAQAGAAGSSGMGGGAGEMLRNEALLLLPVMLQGNADLQKIVAFSGAFEKLFDIIMQEGGTDGGIVVQDALTVIGGLLRFNVSNQNYFRELALIPQIPSILGFPQNLAPDAPAPDEFALQFWPEQKLFNAGLVLGLIRSLVGGPGGGNQSAMVSGGITRCLLELSLASNAPSGLKSQALNTLTPILLSSPPNQNLMANLQLSPLVPVHADEEHPNGGFVRLAMRPAALALVVAVIDGDPSAGGRGLRGRAAGVNMFEAFVSSNDDAKIGLLTAMASVPQPGDPQAATEPLSAGAVILSGLLELPAPGADFDPYRPLFACLLLSHLVRNSEHAKKLAREVSLPSGDSDSAVQDDDDKVNLVQLIVGNLMMASREQTECVNRAAREGKQPGATEEEDWTRVMVGYLVLLCTWLWDSPKTVKDFLSESANLQVLTQPISQATGIDPLVQGLSAFLLGVCYEFNREPGEITRSTLHPILHSRIGPDQFVSRMARLREDARFRAVQPDSFDQENPETQGAQAEELEDAELDEGLELWFDWAFVEFWKNHYYTIQRSIAIDPDAVRGSGSSDDGETAAIIMSLRQKLKQSSEEGLQFQQKISSLEISHKKEKDQLVNEIQSLTEQVASLTTTLQSSSSDKQSHVDELDKLQKELETEKEKIKASTANESALAEVRAELGKAHAALEEAKSSHSTALQEASTTHASALSAATTSHDAKVKELEDAHAKRLKELETEHEEKVANLQKQLDAKPKKGKGGAGTDGARVKELETELEDAKKKGAEQEKEHEDLLVLLEELSQKRKRDKERMKEKGLDVSEGEDEDDVDGDEDDA